MEVFIWHRRYPSYAERMERMAEYAIDWMGLDCGLTLVDKS